MTARKSKESRIVEIWTDGASKGNPGPGGWGALLRYGKHEKELCGGSVSTTNNKMELLGPINALRTLKRPCRIILHTDSKYVVEGITKWIHGWLKNDWKNSQKQPVKNEELWKELYALTQLHEIEWQWVKGHAGIEGNERADGLANKGVEQALAQYDKEVE